MPQKTPVRTINTIYLLVHPGHDFLYRLVWNLGFAKHDAAEMKKLFAEYGRHLAQAQRTADAVAVLVDRKKWREEKAYPFIERLLASWGRRASPELGRGLELFKKQIEHFKEKFVPRTFGREGRLVVAGEEISAAAFRSIRAALRRRGLRLNPDRVRIIPLGEWSDVCVKDNASFLRQHLARARIRSEIASIPQRASIPIAFDRVQAMRERRTFRRRMRRAARRSQK
jgi:hypothetical protein